MISYDLPDSLCLVFNDAPLRVSGFPPHAPHAEKMIATKEITSGANIPMITELSESR